MQKLSSIQNIFKFIKKNNKFSCMNNPANLHIHVTLIIIDLWGTLEPKNIGFMEAAEPWQLSFQDPATPTMEGIINFHHDLMFFIIVISLFVSWLLWKTLKLYTKTNILQVSNVWDRFKFTQFYSHGIYHNTFIEVVWTIVPAIILGIIAIPSFALLYSMEELVAMDQIINAYIWTYSYRALILQKLMPIF